MLRREVRLRDITTLITKGTTPTTVNCAFTDTGVNFIKAESVTLDGRIDSSLFAHIDPDTHDKLRRSQLRAGDILFSIAGMKLGKTGIVRSQHVPANTNQALAIIRPDPSQVLSEYLHYYFLNPRHYQYVNSLTAQAAQPNINLADVGNLPIQLPDLHTQDRIAGILSAYDDLFENNTKRIKILEEMARSLYREWFVNLRFPGHEKVKMVNAPLGKVPEGWQVLPLEQISSFISRGVSPKYSDDGPELVINQKCIRDQRLSLEPARRHASKVPPDKYVQKGDVLINSTGVGTLGRVAQVLDEPQRWTVDTHVTIARPRTTVDATFFGLLLLEKQEHFEGAGVGATGQTELNRTRIAATEVLMPEAKVAAHFGAIVEPLRSLSLRLETKNNVLRRTRDLLLPRLISGEVVVEPHA